MIKEDVITVSVRLQMELDSNDIPTEHQDIEGLRGIIDEVLNAGIYDIPGAEITKLKINFEGIE